LLVLYSRNKEARNCLSCSGNKECVVGPVPAIKNTGGGCPLRGLKKQNRGGGCPLPGIKRTGLGCTLLGIKKPYFYCLLPGKRKPEGSCPLTVTKEARRCVSSSGNRESRI